ncbi:MAG: hypothetical protein AAFU41_16435 [Pseudomonadota bacterium]
MADLNARLLAAHDAGDRRALIDLYTEAADQADEVDAACFFLTHAYIYALEAGSPVAATLYARLKAAGRA